MILQGARQADFVGLVFDDFLLVSFDTSVDANVVVGIVESSACRCAVQAGDCSSAGDHVLSLRGGARVCGGFAVRVSCVGDSFDDGEVRGTFRFAGIRSFDEESNAIRDTR